MKFTCNTHLFLILSRLLLLLDPSTSFLCPVTKKINVLPFQYLTYPVITQTTKNYHDENNISFLRIQSLSAGAVSGDSPSTLEDDSNKTNDTTPKQEEQATTSEDLTEEDWKLLSIIMQESNYDPFSKDNDPLSSKKLEEVLIANLSQMQPRLVLALRQAANGLLSDNEFTLTLTKEQNMQLEAVGLVLVGVMDGRLKSARQLLATFLDSGEVRKLDGEIGRASKEGKLDMAFFTVLNMNMRDAAVEDQMKEDEANGEEIPDATGESDASTARRSQVLQHIYTRCQEELEKEISPGIGLLNKLLRTEVSSIRSNQLRHFLVPEENTITAADGSEIKLKAAKPLVPPEDLIEAMANYVKRIREVERSGVTDRVATAGLVESCRQIAIEARIAIAEGYGTENEILRNFEQRLQPVFRPSSAQSDFMPGN